MKITFDFKSIKDSQPENAESVLYLARFANEGLLLCSGYKLPRENFYYDEISKVKIPNFKVEYWCELPDFN